MFSIRAIVVLSLLHCFLQQIKVSEGNYLKSKKFRHYFEPEWIKFKEDSIGTALTYITCDKDTLEAEEESKCTVIREDNDFQSPIKASTCELSLKNQDRGALPLVLPFGTDKAVILSVEFSSETGQTLKFKTIQFGSCEFKREEIVIPAPDRRLYLLREVSVMTYDDTFEVAFESTSLCNEQLCKATFDINGKKISGPSDWIKIDSVMMRAILPISTRSPARGHFIINDKATGDQLYFAVNNEAKLLKILKYKYHLILSASHNLISFCTQTTQTETAICTQCDQAGKTIFEIGPYHDDVLIRSTLQNLPGGGFIVAMYNPKNTSFAVKKFDSVGKQTGTMNFTEEKCNVKRLYANLWSVFGQFSNEESSGSFCLHLTCFQPTSRDEAGRIDTITKCFNDKDLSV